MANYLVVGASTGIGKKISDILVESNHKVYGTFYKNEVRSFDNRIEYYPLNVLDERLVLDFLPDNLAGIVYSPGTINLRPFDRIKSSDFVNDYQLQVIGAVKIMQEALSKLKANGNASVVLFSSVAVKIGMPFHTQVASSKGAIEGLTKALAAEFAPKIRVNSIAPSLTDTPLASILLNSEQKKISMAERHPLKRIGTADDIANMATYLLSEKSSWITGQIFHVDGGMSSLKS